ncbi:ribosomal RNA small subunit methyltransferase B [Sporosarcina sp. NCCP-2716]|uniref:16S rRNA (cytosine(967)-C(5))-methyltransferase RsmB n=1 Tax=Sporosarcina sp. NCCP-2716 TaxID=2943679 RepID=UPI002041AEFA|nr:16S rRNA (cytosine(967)-C(5))-methyltransferase RsmB [Sporosarcina sp. NCCP-2716]GKV67750.1 ribosomal RNA small subunit methyltransferase B [Sporosarcina sp. NCCP-2716]
MTAKKKPIWKGNVRDAALSILLEVSRNQAYSNLLLTRTIDTYGIKSQDKGLLTTLAYGTLQHRLTLDYYLEPFIKGKLDDWVRELLRLSLYQIVYLTKIPPHAAVNEAVEIAKRRGHKGTASLVNGVLRSVLRQGVRSIEEETDEIKKIALETSHPEWLIRRWIDQYGMIDTREMAIANNIPPINTARVNTVQTSVEKALHQLKSEGAKVEIGKVVPEAIYCHSGNIASTYTYTKGWLTVQDESSMLPVYALDVQPGMKVLDMCAAPGGKTTQIAEHLADTGEVHAHDLHDHKLALIEENADRLGLKSIWTSSGDSRELGDEYEPETFDRILVDAPCSGLGVIRRKPEIKYNKTEADVESLSEIQAQLLETAWTLVKPGGKIVYSTCTVDKTENDGVVLNFLEKHPEAVKEVPEFFREAGLSTPNGMLQVLPQHFGSDGFFAAAIVKPETAQKSE